MRAGHSPQAACQAIVADMLSQTNKWFEVGVIALDTKVFRKYVYSLFDEFTSTKHTLTVVVTVSKI